MTRKQYMQKWWKDNKDKAREYYQRQNTKEYKERKREYARKRRKENPEYDVKYRKEHREECNARVVAWQKSHTEEFQKYQKKYRKENAAKERARQCRWEQAHPDKVRAKRSRRRTLKTSAGGSFSGEEFSALCKHYGGKCLCCGKRRKLTADHVIPVSKGGTSNIDNIQPLCLSCNSKKGTKSTDYRTRRKQ